MAKLDMKQFIPSTIKSGRLGNEYTLHVDEHDDKYFVWYEVPVTNQKGIVSKKRYSESLPKYIDLNEETFEVLGLLQGEMSKTFRRTLTFANSEPGILRKVMYWFEKQNFTGKTSWRWYVRVNLREPENKQEAEQLEKQLITQWLDIGCLRREELNPKAVSYVSSTLNKALDGIGTVMIERGGPIFIQTVQSLVANMTESMPGRSAEEIIPYMRGIIAAESCVNYSLRGSQRRVLITAVKKDERDIFRLSLDRLGITAWDSVPVRCIIISGRDNLLKLKEFDLMSGHPDKLAKFNEMISNYTDWWHERRKIF